MCGNGIWFFTPQFFYHTGSIAERPWYESAQHEFGKYDSKDKAVKAAHLHANAIEVKRSEEQREREIKEVTE